jgi:hypothetical protein
LRTAGLQYLGSFLVVVERVDQDHAVTRLERPCADPGGADVIEFVEGAAGLGRGAGNLLGNQPIDRVLRRARGRRGLAQRQQCLQVLSCKTLRVGDMRRDRDRGSGRSRSDAGRERRRTGKDSKGRFASSAPSGNDDSGRACRRGSNDDTADTIFRMRCSSCRLSVFRH